jgi:hypothetical protein
MHESVPLLKQTHVLDIVLFCLNKYILKMYTVSFIMRKYETCIVGPVRWNYSQSPEIFFIIIIT